MVVDMPVDFDCARFGSMTGIYEHYPTPPPQSTVTPVIDASGSQG